MRIATREKLYTLRDLMELPEDDSDTRYEISGGKIIPLQPNPLDHGFVCGQLFVPLYQFVEATYLGMAGIGGAFLLHHDAATDQAVLDMLMSLLFAQNASSMSPVMTLFRAHLI